MWKQVPVTFLSGRSVGMESHQLRIGFHAKVANTHEICCESLTLCYDLCHLPLIMLLGINDYVAVVEVYYH